MAEEKNVEKNAEKKVEKKDNGNNYKLENFLIQISESKKEKEKVVKDNGITEEIRSIIMIVIGFLLMISIYVKESGQVGKLLKNISSYLFGSGSAFLPIFIISIGIYFIVSKKKVENKILIPFALMYFCLLALMFTFSPIPEGQATPANLQQEFTESIKRGGFVGGVIGAVLIGIIGRLGTILFLIAGIIVFFMLATGKSLFDFLVFSSLYIKRKVSTEINQVFNTDKEESKTKEKKPKDKNLFNYIMNIFNDPDEEVEQTQDKYDTYEPEEENQEQQEEPEQEEQDLQDEQISNNLFYDKEEFQKFDRNKLFEMDNTIQEESSNNFRMPEREDELPIPGKTIRENVGDYKFPSILLLNKNTFVLTRNFKEQAEVTKAELQSIFNEYKVDAKVEKYYRGPTVTRYEISPGQGVKVNRISGLSDEIALKLAARGIRIEAPIPGKPFVGIEIPNKEAQPVFFRDIIDSQNFRQMGSKITFGVGKDIEGNPVVWDVKEMPHLLIAGATGSGKSVCINTLIMSILYKATPDEVKLLMIDPKMVELGVYNGIPHLLIPVVVDPKKAAGALNWAVREMTARYTRFSEEGVRNIEGYNHLKKKNDDETLPQIVIIIDELSDLMQTSSSEVEDNIKRLSQMARAAGIYLIIATQRPSVDVITGVIKANIPSRLAFAVSSGTDSRTILDTVGAEKLLGKGDMLFYPKGMSKPLRLQGAFISDKEVEDIVAFFKKNFEVNYDDAMIDEITSTKEDGGFDDDEVDELFLEAVEFLIEKGKGSASLLQRQFKIGYNRASRLIEQLENRGIVAPADGSKPRKVLMNKAQFDEFQSNN